jgi:hypothetical protein
VRRVPDGLIAMKNRAKLTATFENLSKSKIQLVRFLCANPKIDPRPYALPVEHTNPYLYASATFRTSFPVFSPLKSFSNVSGNVSNPSTMCSRDLSLPEAIHPVISRAASG